MAPAPLDALGEIEDARGSKSRQDATRSSLGIALAAMLANADGPRALDRWGLRLRPEALGALRYQGRQGTVPHDIPHLLSIA